MLATREGQRVEYTDALGIVYRGQVVGRQGEWALIRLDRFSNGWQMRAKGELLAAMLATAAGASKPKA